MPGLENLGKPIEFTEEVHTKIDVEEMKEVIRKIEAGEVVIIKTEHLLRGNGLKYFGESYYLEYLYNCKICLHQNKQTGACGLDNCIHEQICQIFEKVN